MNWPFHDLKITGVIEDRCQVIAGPAVRVYLQLSEMPPVGWSYQFHLAWQAAPHALARRVGIEGDALWIECVPAEVLTHHWRDLESAVARANACYWAACDERRKAEQHAEKMAQEARAQVAALANILNPPAVVPNDQRDDADEEPRGRRWRDWLEQVRRGMFRRSPESSFAKIP